jgi:ClpP class serine protease
VVAVHVDESAADVKAGLAWTFVFAGESKVDGNAHEPLSARARATIQADVDHLYAQLCGLVAANRGLTNEAVRGTNATVYRGELAIRAGLADRLGTLDLAIAEMAAELDRAAMPARSIINPIPKRSTSMAKSNTEQVADDTAAEPQRSLVAQAAPQAPAPNSQPAPPPIQVPTSERTTEPAEPHPAERLREEYAEIAGLAAQAIRLGVRVDAADAMRRGISAADLRRSILDTLAARAEATSVIAAAPSTPVAGDSPIVRRAKERAATAARA